MTCIVGVQGTKSAVIGGDSAAVSGWTMTSHADPKVFAVGAFVYGIAGSFRLGDVLRWQFEPPALDDDDLDAYMHTAWIDALRETMTAKGYARKENEVETLDDGQFMVATRGRLYVVWQDYQIARPMFGYDAIGCGRGIALGALATLKGGPGRKHVLTALTATARHNIGVRGPFVVRRSRCDRQ